jgi:hypothetical protein
MGSKKYNPYANNRALLHNDTLAFLDRLFDSRQGKRCLFEIEAVGHVV